MTATASTTTIDATMTHSIFRKPDNPWGVAEFADAATQKRVKVAGPVTNCELGKSYRIVGRVESTPYGETLKATSVIAIEPKSPEAVASYLQTMPGIGWSTAEAIVKTFGAEGAIRALETEDLESLKAKVPTIRINAEKLADLRLKIEAERSSREINLQIRKLLGDLATDRLVEKILEQWHNDAPATIRQNPWVLADLEHIGFMRADKCALKIGVNPLSVERVKACVMFVVEESRGNGHTRHHLSSLMDEVRRLLEFHDSKGHRELIEDAIWSLCEGGDAQRLVVAEITTSGEWFQTVGDHRNESEIARMLSLRLATSPGAGVIFDSHTPSGKLAEDQVAALDVMLRASPWGTCLLTGAPGTGKTHMVKEFLGYFTSKQIALCAPTGKASKRLSQMTGLPATTIHKLLEPEVVTTKKGPIFGFKRNAENRIEADLVVVDEASMVDASLFRSLLAAIPRSCYLLLVGDPNQLPSVSPGSVLRDLIESKRVPHAQLTTIKRTNPGPLLTGIHAVKDGFWRKIDNAEGADVFMVPASTDSECVSVMADLYLDRLPKLLAKITLEAGDPIADIQLLIPWRSKDGLSARTVNLEIQRRRAAAGAVELGGKWSLGVGDKVIQQKNDYELGIVNGDQGVVVGMLQEEDPKTGVNRWVYRVAFAGYASPISVPAINNNLELGYAITTHRSQGSEWPIVVIPAMQLHSPFYDRCLLYTAMSRAQKALVVVGSQAKMQAVVDRVGAERRRTHLQQLMAVGEKP